MRPIGLALSHPLMDRRAFITVLGGSILAMPLTALAQQSSKSVIGFLHQGSADPMPLTNAFRQGLAETGLSEVTIEHRWAEGRYDRLPALAADLVSHRVSVIAAAFLPAALAAKAATQTIPIVFLSGSDPIAAGLVSSFNRPAGNVTGIAFMFTLLGQRIWSCCTSFCPRRPWSVRSRIRTTLTRPPR